MRSFDPVPSVRLECRAWETYYRRQVGALPASAFALLLVASRVPDELAARRFVGAWLVLRANMKSAPVPGQLTRMPARALMRDFSPVCFGRARGWGSTLARAA